MKTITNFPYKVQVLEHVLIPLSDGIRLAAKIWLPESAKKNPVPVFLGGKDQKELLDKYMHCKQLLPFEFKT